MRSAFARVFDESATRSLSTSPLGPASCGGAHANQAKCRHAGCRDAASCRAGLLLRWLGPEARCEELGTDGWRGGVFARHLLSLAGGCCSDSGISPWCRRRQESSERGEQGRVLSPPGIWWSGSTGAAGHAAFFSGESRLSGAAAQHHCGAQQRLLRQEAWKPHLQSEEVLLRAARRRSPRWDRLIWQLPSAGRRR